MNTKDKIKKLENYLKNKKTILGYSAGSDSTLIAYILSKVSPQSLLVTIDNNMLPPEFINYTKQQAQKLGLKHKIIKINLLEQETFQENRKERCYECRKQMYSQIQKLPEFEQYNYFMEGTNITDLLEDRPGVLVKDMYNMTSPLVECNITKKDVLNMIKYLNLDYSHNTTCLATRIKTNQKVTPTKLEHINNAEEILRKHIKQDNIRIRHDNNTATITVDQPLEILDKNLLTTIKKELQEIGYKKVCLDITGYTKTKLEVQQDNKGNYYHKLPYKINLEKTMQKLEEKYGKKCTLEEKLLYNNITIEENGKISMPPTNDFENKIYTIISCVQRKEV